MSKTLILIHGRSTKPSASAHRRLILDALVNGLRRVDVSAAEQVASGSIKCDFAYYGDINNTLLAATNADAAKALTAANDAPFNHAPCLPEQPIRAALKQIMDVQSHDGWGYGELLRAHEDLRWIDEAASLVSAVASWTFLSEYVVKWATADMSQYLHTRKVGSTVRERLQEHLKPALLEDRDICLISHSMGCIVAYDVLWKFSRMSEYRHIQETKNRVALWLTLGCPLGEPGVRENLYDVNERGEYRFPKYIVKKWANIAAEDDFISHDATMADDFKEMQEYGYVNQITDDSIYNFWVKDGFVDPHNFYGYLDNPFVAEHVARWIHSQSAYGETSVYPFSRRNHTPADVVAA